MDMQDVHFVTVTPQGQISIPAPLRRKFNLHKNRHLVVTSSNSKIELSPTPDVSSLRGVFASKKRLPFSKTRAEFETALATGGV